MQHLAPPRVAPSRVHGLYVLNAFFHYAGPAIAVLTFPRLGVAGAIWLRIASAAMVFAMWRRPWRVRGSATLVALGATLATMNAAFYLAIDRLPLSTVGAVEFLGIIGLAAAGVRNRRNALALLLAVAGVGALADIRIASEPLGFLFAFGNCALFTVYVMLGHRIAHSGVDRVDQLGAAMMIAAIVAVPAGVVGRGGFSGGVAWLAVGAGVGVCSSVIPYVIDQAIMARIRRSSFALLLSILPATATVIGMAVLRQIPTPQDLAGIALVACGVMIHEAEVP